MMMSDQKWNNFNSLLSHNQDNTDDENEVDQTTQKECWCHEIFTHTDEEDELYPVTVQIADAQRADPKLKKLFPVIQRRDDISSPFDLRRRLSFTPN